MPDPGQARALGNPMPEAELDAYRKRGSPMRRFWGTGKGTTACLGKGVPSLIRFRTGGDFEGYSFQSAPVVKLADEDQTEEV